LLAEDILLKIDTEDTMLFPLMETSFDVPSHINEAIIDVCDEIHDFKKICSELYKLLCRHIEIRFFKHVEIETIENIFKEIESSIIEAVDIYIPFSSFTKYEEKILTLLNKNIRLRVMYVHSCPNNFMPEPIERLLFSNQIINSEEHCGAISKFFFSINSLTYFESQLNNTCLNKKISIDSKGNIKNCPSMKINYGNIKETTLQEVLDKTDLKSYWNLNKDQIEVCKDCEFRHICTDCRAYIETPDNIYSKPLKCGYNPESTEWEEWSNNPIKQKAIEYYFKQDAFKSHSK
jgi:SPASM domain peptide maturase of grasp-with-spasm system